MKLLKHMTVGILFLTCALFGHENENSIRSFPKCQISENNFSMKVKNGDLICENNDSNRESIKITEDFDLYVNNRKIKLNQQQRRLTEAYYDQSMRLINKAVDIGFEGGEIGVEGAKLGMKAIASVFKMLSPNYDSDDLERDIEHAAHKIEIKAELLEEKAEGIEAMADDLENQREEMKNHIEELNEIHWF